MAKSLPRNGSLTDSSQVDVEHSRKSGPVNILEGLVI